MSMLWLLALCGLTWGFAIGSWSQLALLRRATSRGFVPERWTAGTDGRVDVPHSASNSVIDHDPYESDYQPPWRLDLRQCAYCHHRVAHWMGVSGGTFRGHDRFMVLCFACHDDLYPQWKPFLEAQA